VGPADPAHPRSGATVDILTWLGLAVVGTAVTWYGAGLLETSSTRLAVHYRLPPIVQGGVVAAVGSSFPELSSAVLATLIHGSFDLGVSAIVGSAIFNITVIPALSAFVARRTLATNRDLVYKEAQFYMLAVSILLLVFSMAVIYNPVEGAGSLTGTVTRPLALVPLAAYGLYLFTQWQDTMDYDPEIEASEVSPLREWTRLAWSMAVVLLGVEALVRSAVELGELLAVPPSFWGLTVIAVGTSLPDAFYSIRTSRKGRAVSSVANVLGSNVFDLLVAVPAGVLVAGAVPVDFGRAVPMLGTLTVVTVLLFAFMRTRLVISKPEAWVLLGFYLGFVTWMALETAGVSALLP